MKTKKKAGAAHVKSKANQSKGAAWIPISIDAAGRVLAIGSPEPSVVELPASAIRRNPDNREPTPEAVNMLAASIAQHGQMEPVVVRPAGKAAGDVSPGERIAEWELISGETRWRACAKLKQPIKARTVQAATHAALELLAVANAARTDLTPIDKARLVARLCAELDAGGSGLTREAAARVVGLDSAAAASNLVRLLELPAEWLARVADGTCPQSYARELLRALPIPGAMAELDESFREWRAAIAKQEQKNRWRPQSEWDSRPDLAREVERTICRNVRPMDKRAHAFSYEDFKAAGVDWQEVTRWHNQKAPRLFKLDDSAAEKLPIVEIELDGKPCQVTTALAAWDELQMPLFVAAERKKLAGSKRPAGDAKQSERDAAATAETREAQLAKRLGRWRLEWLRAIVTAAIWENPTAAIWGKWSFWAMAQRPGPNHRALEDACEALGVVPANEFARSDALFKGIANVKPDKWPQVQAWALSFLVGRAPGNPDYPEVAEPVLVAMAIDAGVNLPNEWARLQTDGKRLDKPSAERLGPLFDEFLGLHSGEQLGELAAEWNVELAADGKTGRVAELAAGDKFLPIPAAAWPSDWPRRGRKAASIQQKRTTKKGTK